MKNKYLMKNAFGIILCAVVIFLGLTSCSENSVKPSFKLTKGVMDTLLSKNITLKDSTYSLDISKEEAIKMGISAQYYDDAVVNMKRVNDMLKETFKEQSYNVSLDDYKNHKQVIYKKGEN
jgi:hypothetical protein